MAESGKRVAALRECEQLTESVWGDQPIELIGIRMGGGHHSARLVTWDIERDRSKAG